MELQSLRDLRRLFHSSPILRLRSWRPQQLSDWPNVYTAGSGSVLLSQLQSQAHRAAPPASHSSLSVLVATHTLPFPLTSLVSLINNGLAAAAAAGLHCSQVGDEWR